MLLGLISTLFSVLSSLHLQGDYTIYQYACGLGFLSFSIAYYASRKMGFLFGTLVTYLCIYSVSMFENMHVRYATYPIQIQNDLSINASFALLISTLFMFSMIEMPRRWLKSFDFAIPAFTVINSLVVLNSFRTGIKLNGGYGYSGLLEYCGMNGVAIALGCAYLIPTREDSKAPRYLKCVGLLLAIPAIILSKCAIPFGVLGIVLSSRSILKNPRIAIGTMAAAISCAYLAVGHKIFDSSHRFEAYRVFIGGLLRGHKFWFGAGIGSFHVWAPHMQLKKGFMLKVLPDGSMRGAIWPTLHSSWLELFFQFGAVGLCLSVAVYLLAVMQCTSRVRANLFSLGLGLGAAAVFDYPLQEFYTAFLAAFFVVSALRLPEPS